MEIRVKSGRSVEEDADLLILGIFSQVEELAADAVAVDRALGGAIRELMAEGDFTGKVGETLLLYTRGALSARRVLLIGLGDRESMGGGVIGDAGARAIREARDLGVLRVSIVLPQIASGTLDLRAASQAVLEGAQLGLYRFAGHKSAPAPDWKADPESLVLVVPEEGDVQQAESGAWRAELLARSVRLARDLVNEPANHMTPSMLAARAESLAESVGAGIRVLGEEEIRDLGMGIFLAVTAESAEPPRLIVFETNSGRSDLPTVVLVGKGVTFDSGGISLKPVEEMWRMKDDMGGAAAVICAAAVAAQLQLPLHVVALAPCAENLPGGKAHKPGDVYRGLSGKTMEVISTDCEGRMLLADALAYAARFHPDAVVDIASLTASQSIALGPKAAALFSNDESLAGALLAAADATGERLWRMPLYDDYADAIKSVVADVKNSGGKYGGVGASAKFLEHFTEDYRWAHIDMASMVWSEEDRPVKPRGATGYGVRLLAEFLERFAG